MCLLGSSFINTAHPSSSKITWRGLRRVKFLFVVQTYICLYTCVHTHTHISSDLSLNLVQGSTGQDLGLPKGPKGIGLQGVPWQLGKGTPSSPILPYPRASPSLPLSAVQSWSQSWILSSSTSSPHPSANPITLCKYTQL